MNDKGAMFRGHKNVSSTGIESSNQKESNVCKQQFSIVNIGGERAGESEGEFFL